MDAVSGLAFCFWLCWLQMAWSAGGGLRRWVWCPCRSLASLQHPVTREGGEEGHTCARFRWRGRKCCTWSGIGVDPCQVRLASRSPSIRQAGRKEGASSVSSSSLWTHFVPLHISLYQVLISRNRCRTVASRRTTSLHLIADIRAAFLVGSFQHLPHRRLLLSRNVPLFSSPSIPSSLLNSSLSLKC